MTDFHTNEPLLIPFAKMVFGATALLGLTQSSLAESPDDETKHAVARQSMAGLASLLASLNRQLDDLIAGRPCQCESCKAERATAMAQAEAIFNGGE